MWEREKDGLETGCTALQRCFIVYQRLSPKITAPQLSQRHAHASLHISHSSLSPQPTRGSFVQPTLVPLYPPPSLVCFLIYVPTLPNTAPTSQLRSATQTRGTGWPQLAKGSRTRRATGLSRQGCTDVLNPPLSPASPRAHPLPTPHKALSGASFRPRSSATPQKLPCTVALFSSQAFSLHPLASFCDFRTSHGKTAGLRWLMGLGPSTPGFK